MPEQALPRFRRAAALAALLGIVLCVPFALADLAAFWRAYLTAFVAWLSVPLGCLALLLTYHIAGGPWGRMLGEALEAGARTLPLVALLGLPLLFDLDALFPWARPDYLAHEQLVRHKTPYLNPPFFVARTLAWLALWAVLAWLMTDRRRALALRPRRQALAAVAAILFALSASFAAVDWALSIDPRFNSATFGLVMIGGHLNAGLAFAALTTLVLARIDRRAEILAEAPMVGLGGLLLGAILLWAYLAAMEYLVVWSGDLPHNAAWFLERASSGWFLLLALVGLGHFVVPFALLLSARLRQDWRVVSGLAALILAMQLLYLVWKTAPAWGPETPPPVLIAGALLAVGGIWLLMASINLAARDQILVPRETVVG